MRAHAERGREKRHRYIRNGVRDVKPQPAPHASEGAGVGSKDRAGALDTIA
ncbi:MAG: hypothetical protein RIT28_4211 [Pseudomonadota bacterium]|jgi:hypothetical protein